MTSIERVRIALQGRRSDRVPVVAIIDGTEGGPFMLTRSNSIHSGCRPENVLAMLEAAREFGTECRRRRKQ